MFWYIGKIILLVIVWLVILFVIYMIIENWNAGGKLFVIIFSPIILAIVMLIKFPIPTLIVLGVIGGCLFIYNLIKNIIEGIKEGIKEGKSEKEMEEKIVLNEEDVKGKRVGEMVEYVCGECGGKVTKRHKKCPHCKAELIWK